MTRIFIWDIFAVISLQAIFNGSMTRLSIISPSNIVTALQLRIITKKKPSKWKASEQYQAYVQ